MFKMATPQKFQFRMTKGWQNIWFRRTNEVHYIGGSDVLPAPLEAQEEAKMLENLEGGEHQEEAKTLRIRSFPCVTPRFPTLAVSP